MLFFEVHDSLVDRPDAESDEKEGQASEKHKGRVAPLFGCCHRLSLAAENRGDILDGDAHQHEETAVNDLCRNHEGNELPDRYRGQGNEVHLQGRYDPHEVHQEGGGPGIFLRFDIDSLINVVIFEDFVGSPVEAVLHQQESEGLDRPEHEHESQHSLVEAADEEAHDRDVGRLPRHEGELEQAYHQEVERPVSEVVLSETMAKIDERLQEVRRLEDVLGKEVDGQNKYNGRHDENDGPPTYFGLCGRRGVG